MNDTIRGLVGLVVILAGLHEPETGVRRRWIAQQSWFSASRNQPIEGQIAVAEVVYQRGEPCDVMNEPGQFHSVRDWPAMPRDPEAIDPHAWRVALAAAWIAQERLWPTECAGSTHFTH